VTPRPEWATMHTIGRYLTPENIRLGLTGLGAGAAVGLAWRLAGRRRWGALPFVLAVLVAARHAGRSDRPHWDGMALAGAVIMVAAGIGASRLLAHPTLRWEWVAAGALASAGCIWGGVPETGPVVLAGGALAGLTAVAALTRARWAPSAGLGAGAVLGWAALSGAAGGPWAAVGGALCSGLAPWFAVRPFLPAPPRARVPGPWLFGAHLVLAVLAARWIGVVPDAGWLRVGFVAAAGAAVAAATSRRA
jgi:hypothetical protein